MFTSLIDSYGIVLSLIFSYPIKIRYKDANLTYTFRSGLITPDVISLKC